MPSPRQSSPNWSPLNQAARIFHRTFPTLSTLVQEGATAIETRTTINGRDTPVLRTTVHFDGDVVTVTAKNRASPEEHDRHLAETLRVLGQLQREAARLSRLFWWSGYSIWFLRLLFAGWLLTDAVDSTWDLICPLNTWIMTQDLCPGENDGIMAHLCQLRDWLSAYANCSNTTKPASPSFSLPHLFWREFWSILLPIFGHLVTETMRWGIRRQATTWLRRHGHGV